MKKKIFIHEIYTRGAYLLLQAMWVGDLDQKREVAGGRGKFLTRFYNIRGAMKECGLISKREKNQGRNVSLSENDEGKYSRKSA